MKMAPIRPTRLIAASFALALAMPIVAWGLQEKKAADPKALVGVWKVDLRAKPDAAPYFKEFVVKALDGNTFTGEFYGTEIEQGRVNADWGDVHFAFVTRDGSGPYNHSGVLRAGKLEGLSHSLGRDFLLVWRGERAE